MNRDIKRGCLSAKNSLKLFLADVGQRDVIAHHQAQTPVVIPDIQRGPHPGGHLVQKAEDAVIFAGPGLQNCLFIQLKPQWRIDGLV